MTIGTNKTSNPAALINTLPALNLSSTCSSGPSSASVRKPFETSDSTPLKLCSHEDDHVVHSNSHPHSHNHSHSPFTSLTTQRRSDGDPSGDQSSTPVIKRRRRGADEIKRHFVCTAPHCNKSYGSESALKMHMKIKHSGDGNVGAEVQTSPEQNQAKLLKHLVIATALAEQHQRETEIGLKKQKIAHIAPTPSPAPVTPSNSIVAVNTPKENLGFQLPRAPITLPTLPLLGTTPVAAPTPKVPSLPTITPISSSTSPQSSLGNSINLPVTKLKMGLWQRQSIYYGDLIARISLADRCFYWECLNLEGLLRIKVSFDGLQSLQLDDSEGLLLKLSTPATYSIGLLQEGSTCWSSLPDFTACLGGDFMTHHISFSKLPFNTSTLLEILQIDTTLQKLVLTPATTISSK